MKQIGNDDVMEKIKKLIAKAKGTDNETEAQLFMSKASQLLTKHGMSMLDLENESKEEDLVKTMTKIAYGDGSGEGRWEDTLLATLCTFNLCESIIYPKSKTMTLIGREENIQATHYMFEASRDIMRGNATKRYAEYRKQTLEEAKEIYPDKDERQLKREKLMSRRDSFRRAYLQGSVMGFYQKLTAEKEVMLKEEAQHEEDERKEAMRIGEEYSVVPFSTKLQKLENDRKREIQEFKDEHYDNLEDFDLPKRELKEADATRLGIQDGKNIQLGKSIEASDYDIEDTKLIN